MLCGMAQKTFFSRKLAAILACGCVASGGSYAAGSAPASYDSELCVTAQRLLVNAGDELPVRVQRGSGNGFHVIQMSVDTDARAAVIAMSTTYRGESDEPAYIACKMVNRERLNAELGAAYPAPDRRCADINRYTYDTALNSLSSAERNRYLQDGRPLEFTDDTIIATGGEWLPVTLDDAITYSDDMVSVSAPSVEVPWNNEERNFYQGTKHCKLISVAALQRWMTDAAFKPDGLLVPLADKRCTAPATPDSTAGSCLFYFAPADAMFCQDYNGSGWNEAAAREECAARHASQDALKAAKNRYEGAGGIYDQRSCTDRPDSPPISGTCVFHCGTPDEKLWNVSGMLDPRMTKGCDLFVPANE